ncbi:TPA: PIN domain-containing protein [Photobacterium damselae]|uniref:PIN domain-containing protein n=1 Tax=Photobacterium damselae TaxID=38293 RepID=UPI003C6E8D40
MKIFIDTNVFYNDWFMKQANFKYLFHYIANECEELVMSKVVCEEVENIRKREAALSLTKINDELKNLKKLLPFQVSFDSSEIESFDYGFIDEIENKCENLTIIYYENISQSEVVRRALSNRKPFTEGEKGYRDTLIWLSLLQHLKEKNYSGDVAFISKNTSDFFVKKQSEFHLHSDLLEDLKSYEITANIIPYDSLFSFVNRNIEKDKHVVEHSKIMSILESEGCDYFSSLSGSALSSVLSRSRLNSVPLQNLIFSSAEIFEGLEDEYLENSKEMKGDDVFVSYSFNLRRVILSLEIPKSDYEASKDIIDKQFYDVEIKTDSVYIETVIRPYYDISFIYNTETEDYKDVSIYCYNVR